MAASCTAQATDWPQMGFDARHSSNNTAETAITRDNVARLTLKYATPVAASMACDTAPIYASGIETPAGTKDLLFITASGPPLGGFSMSSVLIAIDAADGSIVWTQATFGSYAHVSSTPALDPGRGYVYAYGVDGYVHKYRIGDGVETITQGPVGWPALITLKPDVEKVAGGLSIAETDGAAYLIASTDGYYGDGGDYQGHITSIDLATGAQHVFNAMCSDITTHLAVGTCPNVRSGIWGRASATYDPATDRIYFATGNGLFDANAGGFNWGDSVLALAADGSSSGGMPIDSFTPTIYDFLDGQDQDLGITSPAIVPAPPQSSVAHLGLQIGKYGTWYLLDLDDMSGTGQPGGVGGELQALDVGFGDPPDQPAVWVDPDDGSTWLFMAYGAWQLVLDDAGVPTLESRWTGQNYGMALVANGIVFWGGSVNAVDPRTGETLWANSGSSGGAQHWGGAIVADGALYYVDYLGNMTKWALPPTHVVTPTVNDPGQGAIDPSDPESVFEGDVARFTVTPTPPYVIADVSGCGVAFDGSQYVTQPIVADCIVTATFALDSSDRIFADGFEDPRR
ncbi:MAG TPA: PQQ-binding-like beta-propeller repeat protein [Rhodanobacteraceae bacterium]|nr:PQQ-binding-like beta-propeller repeat protein [Rhodanobacteraceae bacterium]